MEDMAEKGQPYYAYLSFYAVHAPIQTTEELWRKYRDKIDSLGFGPGPPVFGGEGSRIQEAQQRRNPGTSGKAASGHDGKGLEP